MGVMEECMLYLFPFDREAQTAKALILLDISCCRLHRHDLFLFELLNLKLEI